MHCYSLLIDWLIFPSFSGAEAPSVIYFQAEESDEQARELLWEQEISSFKICHQNKVAEEETND